MTSARWVLLAATLSVGCEISRGSDYEDFGQPPQPGFGGFTGGSGGFPGDFPGVAGVPGGGGAAVRATTSAPNAPPAITGGTLLITRDGKYAVAADPDRDRLSIVSLADRTVLHTIVLQAGDEPGRVVEDSNHRVHVALRRGGDLVTVDLATGTIAARRAVCGVPRGVAYDAETDQVHVACAGGQLVSFLASGGDAVRSLRFDMDLRDVIATREGLLVSRFKSAELLRVAPSGELVGRTSTRGITRSVLDFNHVDANGNPKQKIDDMEPAVAWRTVGSADGTTVMLHQYALSGPVVIEEPKAEPGARPIVEPSGGGYGAPMGTCGGIVQPGISTIDADGTVHAGAPLLSTVLAVDAATSFDSEWIAVAVAGASQLSQRADLTLGQAEIGRVNVYGRSKLPATEGGTECALPDGGTVNFTGQATAVAFNPSGGEEAQRSGIWFIVQTRDPASLVLVRDAFGTPPVTIPLGGATVFDTGHEQFHRDSGGGIACASCHAEGTEDGRTWQFDPIGPRRTQAIDVGLEGTAPFHWDGDMTDFPTLVNEVFVHRMGGLDQGPLATTALSRWIFALEPREPVVDSADVAALRGKAIFTSEGAQCSTCHSGDKFMSNTSVEVGTTDRGHKLQVPSLVGIAYRAPFLHDGRAKTLRERFDPSKGGGDKHGRTSHLTAPQIDDLIAYLSSI
jgi:mono/diheme cytochrome c family protein